MSETRALIAETAARLFDDLCTREVVEQAEAGTWPEALWRTVEETGLTRALLADAAAGEAATFGDAAVIVRCAGRSAVPLPLAETLLAGWLLSGSGLAVPEGPLTIAPTDRGSTLSLAPADGGWRLSGGVRAVPWGRAVRAVALVVDAAHGPLVALVDPADGELHDGHNLAGEPRDDLTFSDLALPGDRVAPAGAGIDGRALRRRGALMRALQMAGALERVLARTVAYASDRAQFGRPIARFQAIQHSSPSLPARWRRPVPPSMRRSPPSSGARPASPSPPPRRAPARRRGAPAPSPTRCTAPSASPTSTTLTTAPAGCGRGATSSAARASGRASLAMT